MHDAKTIEGIRQKFRALAPVMDLSFTHKSGFRGHRHNIWGIALSHYHCISWRNEMWVSYIVWDAVEVVDFKRKHTANVRDGLDEIRRGIA